MNRREPPLEVLRHAFEGIAEQMGEALHRSAYTVVIKDLNDYSCALFDTDGFLIAQGNNMPTHLGSMGHALQDLILFWGDDIGAGDVFVSNDPYRGGTHTPDVHIFMPIFHDHRRIAWAGNIAHHADWGGRVPGSMSVQNRSIYEEGVAYPHVRLESAGRPNRDVYELIVANIRQPEAGLGDLRAQVTAARSAVARMQALLERYSADVLVAGMDALLRSSEASTRRHISELPDGTYHAEGYLDGNGLPDSEPVRIVVRVEVSGSELTIDFTGTAVQQPTAINIPAATTRSAAMYALRTLLDPSIPANAGCYRPLRITMPAGSLVNPLKPAPVSDRHLSSQRLADVLLRAFAQIDPDAASAGWFVGAAWFSCFLQSPKTNRDTMLLLNLCGGAGATAARGGLSATDCHMANATLIPAEVVEDEYPLRVQTYALRAGSGGRGRHAGGTGLRAEFTNTSQRPINVQTGMEQTDPQFAPWGAAGGEPGACGYLAIRKQAQTAETPLGPRALQRLHPGETLIVCTGGGGGYGSPTTGPGVDQGRCTVVIKDRRCETMPTSSSSPQTY